MTDLRKAIIHESLRLFSLKGYQGTSITDILRASGASKGGFYNHFPSKEHLFLEALEEARRIWRAKCLVGLDETDSPTEKIRRLLENYKDRYLKDVSDFPGGCIFITFAVELADSYPHLAKEVNAGFVGLKRLFRRLLDEGKERGELPPETDTAAVAELLFAGMVGAALLYNVDKSYDNLDTSIACLTDYLERLKKK
jgi:TetR/AcrR family transcriptional repressor of nem operon